MAEWGLTLAALLGGLSLLLALNMPVGLAFLLVSIGGLYVLLGGTAALSVITGSAFQSIAQFAFTPIPMFLLIGDILFQTGLAVKAIDAVNLIVRRVPGRLAVIALVGGTIFSAVSGSTIATTAMLGSLLLPEMLRRGYERKFAMGPIMAIGAVDMLIPPSGLTVLFGGLSGISISGLLLGGLVPGLLLSAIFIAYIVLTAWLKPELAPPVEAPQVTGWARWGPFVTHVVPLALIVFAVIGSIVLGWATPTESAAVGAATTLVYAAAYRALTLKALVAALKSTATVTAMIMFIIVGATAFSQILAVSGVTAGIVDAVAESGLQRYAILAGMLAILLVLGLFIDEGSTMMLTVPLFMPLVRQYGFDEIWFGVLYLICMQLGLLSPPFGLLLFTMKGVAPAEISMSDIMRAVTPYMIMGLAMLALVFLVPQIATWLPRAL